MEELLGSNWAGRPACHVFNLGNETFAYDLHQQQLLAVEPELAALLHGEEEGTEGARAALRRAREKEGLFLTHRPRLVPRPLPSSKEVDQGLRHLVLTVTEACNLRCTYCLHGADLDWVRGHGQARMSVETALSAVNYCLDRCDPDRAPTISFYGGEPLMNREVIAKVVAATRQHARGAEAVFAIDTNGVFLDEAVIDLVIREKIHLQISLDGPQEIHDRFRRDTRGNPTFDRIMANIGQLLDRDPSASDRLLFVVTLAPPVDLPAVSGFFLAFPPYLERGISEQPDVTVNFANLKGQNWEHGQEEAMKLPPVSAQLAHFREVYLEAFSVCKRHEISPVIRALFEPDLIRFFHRSRVPMGDTYTPGGNCRPGRRKLHITVDGRWQPCERTGDVMSLGTIETGIRIQNVETMYERFHDAVKDRCGKCWALRLCGVCFSAQAENSNVEAGEFPVPESVCRRVRAEKEEILKMMVRVLAMPAEAREWLDKTKLD